MEPPPWSLLRLQVSEGERQDIILVYHGNAEEDVRFTPSEEPLFLQLGRETRSWRGDAGFDLGQLSTAVNAVQARQGADYPELLRAPSVRDGIDPLSLVGRVRRGVSQIPSDWRPRLIAVLQPLTIIAGILTVVMWATTAFSPDLFRGHSTPHSKLHVPSIESTADSYLFQPHTLIKTIRMTRNLRDLLLKHHKPLHDSWAVLDEKFDLEVETTINKLNMLLTPSSALNSPSNIYSTGDYEASPAEILNMLNALHTNLRAHGQHRKSWDNEALAKWINMATWWSWGEPDFDPWNYLPESISGNDTATILNTFTSVIIPQNSRIYHLVDEILCSGYDSLLPWQGMRAHYAQAHDSLALLLEDVGGILSPLARRGEHRFSKKGEIDNLVEEFLSTAQWAYNTVQVGLGAARTLDVEIGSICATITQAAQIEWRVLARDNSLLFRQFVPDGDKDNVIEVWLTWPPTTEAIADLTDATSIVWGSRFRNR
ncbi:hypothetical protein F4813DRAFT_365001 [Daldinia decipiens]|uniref:uncharacterized protein n=1 Tax=Daldinia decipiens TaxID=326647 RepID=UPI0020C3B991|nr:uncharacterized protein F4813DRAFT_365001 [Daldinia decipiens]KAI1656000.1 hypothetical protein F4813DRAFT_365001 [Daldinia decipiens]